MALHDADLEHLPELPQLQELVLNNTLVTDGGLVHLGKYASIHKLWLENTKITDKGLVHLQRLPGLELPPRPRAALNRRHDWTCFDNRW